MASEKTTAKRDRAEWLAQIQRELDACELRLRKIKHQAAKTGRETVKNGSAEHDYVDRLIKGARECVETAQAANGETYDHVRVVLQQSLGDLREAMDRAEAKVS